MYTNHYGSIEYPFECVFYNIKFDDSPELEEQSEEEVEIFRTACDMSDGTNLNTDTFTIFFPFEMENETLAINIGDLMKIDVNGMIQRGRVIGIYPSQLGGCTVLLTRN